MATAASEDFKNHVEKTLDEDLDDINRRVANNPLSSAQAARGIQELEDQKLLLSGLATVAKGLGYAGAVADIYKADTSVKQQEAEGKLAVKLGADIAKSGVSRVAPRLFGKAVAASLGGPVTFAAAILSDTFSSEKSGRDPTEVIRDTSGHSSLADKQRALFEEWHWYQNHKATWGEAQTRELIQNTELVYEDYLRQQQTRAKTRKP